MKLPLLSLRRGVLLAAFALITSLTVSAANSFEGRIHMTITSSEKKDLTGVDYAMKDGKLRIDPQLTGEDDRGPMGMIFDMQTRQMTILMEMRGRKMFMRRQIPQRSAEETAKLRAEAGDEAMAPPVPTGRTEMIAGYEATEYRMTNKKGDVVDLWLAKGLGPFMSFSGGNPMMGGGNAPPPGWEKFVHDGNSFPLRVVVHDAKGAETMHMEVTKVEKMSLPDSLFSTDGYSEFQMPNFGGAFNPFKQH